MRVQIIVYAERLGDVDVTKTDTLQTYASDGTDRLRTLIQATADQALLAYPSATAATPVSKAVVAGASEAEVRAAERERVARALEEARNETWNGGMRRPSNFGVAASFVRGLQ